MEVKVPKGGGLVRERKGKDCGDSKECGGFQRAVKHRLEERREATEQGKEGEGERG